MCLSTEYNIFLPYYTITWLKYTNTFLQPSFKVPVLLRGIGGGDGGGTGVENLSYRLEAVLGARGRFYGWRQFWGFLSQF